LKLQAIKSSSSPQCIDDSGERHRNDLYQGSNPRLRDYRFDDDSRKAGQSQQPDQSPRGNDHTGTATLSTILSTASAAVIPSISNSGRRINRCSSTGRASALTSSGVT